MSRFVAFEDRALNRRLQRLSRSEIELEKRIKTHAAEAKRAGHYVPADPAYQRLAAILRTVRRELDDTAQEQLRREGGTNPHPRARVKQLVPPRGRTTERLGPKVTSGQYPAG